MGLIHATASQETRETVSLKGQSNEIFDLQSISSFEPAWSYSHFFGVLHCVESVSLQYDTALSQSSRSIIHVLWGVTHDPSHFLKLLHRPLKGHCHKNKC